MRNINRQIANNVAEAYRQLRKSRDKEFKLIQYRTPTMDYPTMSERADIEVARHTWKVGDRYYKLAYDYYGQSTYWWVIALFNKKPTEGHVKIGDTIFIPQPLDRVLLYCNVK